MEACLTHEEFTKHLNTKFQVQNEENIPVELELIEISEMKLYPKQEEFSLEFRSPLNMFLSQGVHNFSHEEMGQFELFIVPFKQDDQGFYYQAIFNRLRE